jgi:integrating conjugative element protein (TIGR03765 family)
MQIRPLILISFLIVATGNALAAPEVIADFGGRPTGMTTPAEYLESQGMNVIPEAPAIPPALDRFPMESSMVLGPVEPRKHNQSVLMPFFIMGADQPSIEWLLANAGVLQEMSATGMVTNIDSWKTLQRIRELVPGLTLESIPLDSMIPLFGLTHYPVLITQEEITQ